jgi:hypothetical protein
MSKTRKQRKAQLTVAEQRIVDRLMSEGWKEDWVTRRVLDAVLADDYAREQAARE